MKKTIALLAMASLATLAFAQAAAPAPAPQNQIDIGGGFYDTDPTGVYSNFYNSTTNGQSGKYSPSANWNGKYTYTLPIDSANTVKFALADDGWFGFYSGSVTGKAQNQNQNAGVITPLVEYLGFGLDITASLPVYYVNPGDASGQNEIKYAYKESGYMPGFVNSSDYPIGTNTGTINGQLKAFYKYSFDKTTWVQAGTGVLYTFTPTPWLTDVQPKVSAAIYGFQLDAQYDFFNAYAATSAAQYQDQYLEPKLTYDFGFLGLVSGLKLYTSARLSVWTNNPGYNGMDFHDSFIQPGVNYTLGLGSFGSFNFDAGWRFAKFDNVGSVGSVGANGSAPYTGATGSDSKDVAPYSDLRLAVVYTYKF